MKGSSTACIQCRRLLEFDNLSEPCFVPSGGLNLSAASSSGAL